MERLIIFINVLWLIGCLFFAGAFALILIDLIIEPIYEMVCEYLEKKKEDK